MTNHAGPEVNIASVLVACDRFIKAFIPPHAMDEYRHLGKRIGHALEENSKRNERLDALTREAAERELDIKQAKAILGLDEPLADACRFRMEDVLTLRAERDARAERIKALEEALGRLSREAPLGDYMLDPAEPCNSHLLLEELGQRADFARAALAHKPVNDPVDIEPDIETKEALG